MKKISVIVCAALCVLGMSAQTMNREQVAREMNTLARTPQMGWNSWNLFKENISEDLIKGVIDAFVTSGLKDAGYTYVNLDDCWHGDRDADGMVQVNAKKFPSGMKALSDYAHSKGLKFGIYTCAGTMTCAHYTGSLGHEYQDALQYARWGIDYIKEDWCNTEDVNPIGAYRTMHDAILASGRPMLLSLCEWGSNKPWKWAKGIGHSWRTTGDIENNFESVLKILDLQDGLREYAGPGHWNDPDMLEVGNGMSVNEDRAHFSLWCMLNAPLLLGNDVRNMSRETAGILLNKEVIALNQDPLGVQALKVKGMPGMEYWLKPLAGGDWALCVLNRTTAPKTDVMDWQKLNVNDELSKCATDFDTKEYTLKNLWSGKMEGKAKKLKKITVPGHDVLLYRLVVKE